jgi:methyl-accepting chemotaxis protein
MSREMSAGFFADLSIKVKILAAVGVAALVALAVGLVGLVALSEASVSAQLIYADNVGEVHAMGQISASSAQTRVDLANHVISEDSATRAIYAQSFEADLATFDAALAAYRAGRPAGKPQVLADLQTNWQSFSEIARAKQLPHGENHDLTAWQQVRDTEINPLFVKINADIATLTTAESTDAAAKAAAAKSDYHSSRLQSIILLAAGLIVALGLGLLVARSIVRALTKVKDVCDGLAAGDLTRTAGLTSRDEPGRMGQALDSAMVKLRLTVTTINGSAFTLASASEEMSSVATQMASSAEETSAQALSVSAAAEEISRSVDTASSGSEEMGASIREISQNATEAARVAGEAVTITAATSTTMSKLGESSAEIGNVIKVITSIAAQTNLLALNATIEAARAGDAGKGFAVVASEVKDLAQETARATEDISRRVQAIQTDTIGAVTAIEEITRVIARISDFQTTIASAVEEQTATTAEMNRSVSEAATGSSSIAEGITGVAESARLTSQGVAETQQATSNLARMSTELSALVTNFRY